MGVKIRSIIPDEAATVIDLKRLDGRTISVDTHNILYQFLSIIRGVDGRPLMDSRGRITSHLSGLFFRTINLLEAGVRPMFVFDGKPPKLKKEVVKKRTRARREAKKLYVKALEKGKLEEARKHAMRATTVNEHLVMSSKDLLKLMGTPIIQAPSEGEAQAAMIVTKGDAFATASQDMDSMLFGSPRLVRNLSIVGKRRLPGRKAYVEVKPELIDLSRTLKLLNITRDQLIDLGILVGTDYSAGIKGIGPKKALKLIRSHGSADKALGHLQVELEVPIDEVRRVFAHPNVVEEYELEWRKPDYGGVVEYLCGEHDFSVERVEKALDRLKEASSKRERETRLDSWLKPT